MMEISTRYYYSRQQNIFYTYVLRRQYTVMVHLTLPYQCLTGLYIYLNITIHAFVGDVMFPLVFSLLPKRDIATYNRFFTLLKDIASRHNLNFSTRRVSLDFECASRNAATDTFPTAELYIWLSISLLKDHLEKDSGGRVTNCL